MYLSDAIRLGSMMKPQCFGGLRRHDGSCAMGAALDAIGSNLYPHLHWPWINEEPSVCPVCLEKRHPILRNQDMTATHVITMHLNDEHKWTREQIADWVEEQEYHLGIRVKEAAKDEVPELQEVR